MPDRTYMRAIREMVSDVKGDIDLILETARAAKYNIKGGNYGQAGCNVDRIIAKLKKLKREIG